MKHHFVSFVIIFIFIHYLSSFKISQLRYKFAQCALYHTNKRLQYSKRYKYKIQQTATLSFVYCIPPPISFYFYFCIILNTVTVYSILTQLFQPLMKTSFVQSKYWTNKFVTFSCLVSLAFNFQKTKRSFQIPPFAGCPFVEGTSSRHAGLVPPLAV